MYNSRDSFYKTPFGAVRTGEEVTFRLCLPREIQSPAPVLELYADPQGGAPLEVLEMAPQGENPQGSLYFCVYTPAAPGVRWYSFGARGTMGPFRLLRQADGSSAVNQGERWQLTVYDDYSTPPQLEGAVFYQIFPDRFCSSGKAKTGVPGDRLLHPQWGEAPVDRPDEKGRFLCNDYFGGDLEGIRSRLDYLAGLGVEAIYLNPVFEAHSNHRYNTADYRKIDPLLGDEEDFRALCADAKALGIRIVLDGVFNHTGSDSLYFNKEKRYGEHTGACNDPDSPYRDWYSWKHYPDSYDSWWGFLTLPNVNEDCAAYREFICGEEGVLHQWLDAGAAGFRLDVADELPDSFIREIRQSIKARGEDKFLLGEVWEDASSKYSYGQRRQYLLGQELDSVMNYPWRTAILRFLQLGEGAELENAILDLLENYPAPTVGVLLNCLSTHDVARCITALAAPDMTGKDREWQRRHNTLTPEQYFFGRQLFLLASVIQYTLPGCPSLYYGDEAGLVGYADPFNRGTYPWGREDQGLVEFFRLLGQLRKGSQPLRRGDFAPICFDDRCCVYRRSLGEQTVLVAVNRSGVALDIPWGDTLPPDPRVLLTVGGADGVLRLHPRSALVLAL